MHLRRRNVLGGEWSKIGSKSLPNSFIHQFQHVMLNLTSRKKIYPKQMVNLMGKFEGHKSFGNDMDAYFTRTISE